VNDAATPLDETVSASGEDPGAELPVPAEMYPTEVDARGDAVEVLRAEQGLPPSGAHDEDRGASYA
jgi:hypothetical protein